MQPAGDSSPKARHRARSNRRAARRRLGPTYRAIAWKLIKDTTNTCVEYRVTGLAAEVAFFTLMSVPPLLLSIAGTLGYLSQGVIARLDADILRAAGTFLTPASVHETVTPLLNSVFSGGRPDLISIGFLLALWSGSRALYVFVDTVTIMYGLEDQRGIVHTRLLSLGLYVAALLAGTVIGPVVIAGPDQLVRWFPATGTVVHALYWPAAILLSVLFMTTLYHVAVPVRTAWREDVPGAIVALIVFFVCSVFLRLYLVHSVEGPTVYSSLAAPVAVLLWIGVTALAVLVGAAMNAAIDRMWPTRETEQARAANEKAREEAALEVIRRAEAKRAATRNRAANPKAAPEQGGEPEAPAEYPERWADFLPPADVRRRIQGKNPPRRRYPSPFDDQQGGPDQQNGQDQQGGPDRQGS